MPTMKFLSGLCVVAIFVSINIVAALVFWALGSIGLSLLPVRESAGFWFVVGLLSVAASIWFAFFIIKFISKLQRSYQARDPA